MSSTFRAVCATLLVGYLLFLGFVLLEASADLATSVVARVELWLGGLGAPAQTTAPGRVEFLLNTAMFAPAAFLLVLTFPRHPWANWVVYALVASGAVELVQGLFLPLRSAQFEDVVANTMGAALGAVLGTVALRLLLGTRGRDPASGPAGR